MPIDGVEERRSREPGTMEAQILALLKSQPGRVFSLSEIVDGVLGWNRLFHGQWIRLILGRLPEKLYEEQHFKRALERLVEEGEVKVKVVKKALGDSICYIAV